MKKTLKSRLQITKQTLRPLALGAAHGGKGAVSRLCDRPSVDEPGCTSPSPEPSHAATCGDGTMCSQGCTN